MLVHLLQCGDADQGRLISLKKKSWGDDGAREEFHGLSFAERGGSLYQLRQVFGGGPTGRYEWTAPAPPIPPPKTSYVKEPLQRATSHMPINTRAGMELFRGRRGPLQREARGVVAVGNSAERYWLSIPRGDPWIHGSVPYPDALLSRNIMQLNNETESRLAAVCHRLSSELKVSRRT